MIAFDEILDRKLPVGVRLEAGAAAVTQQGEIVVPPAFVNRAHQLDQRRSVAGQIDEHQIVPQLAAHRFQTVFALAEETLWPK